MLKLRFLPVLLLLPIYVVLYKIYIPRVNAFGCFDDCFNIVAGYFITNGKRLYSEIFFNHQPLMAYFSSFIQTAFHPINIYDLILTHRQSIMAFSFVMNVLIVFRFGLPMLGFVLLYEFSKFYVFGDRFLAEGLIVYPLVYMTGILWYKLQNKKIYFFEYLITGVFSWFVIFMREAYIPLALFIFALIVWDKRFHMSNKIGVIAFLFLTSATFFLVPFKDYIFNVVTVNYKIFFDGGTQASSLLISSILEVFFYPIFLFFGGDWNIFRHFMIGLDLVFLISLLFLIRVKKERRVLLVLFLILGFANFRIVPPGKIFYAAFHMIVWYGLFIATVIFLLKDLSFYKKKIVAVFLFLLIILLFYIIGSPKSFTYDKTNPHYELITNYGKELQVGEVVRVLSKPTDTLFLDGGDDLIYWQSKRISSYRYSWYTSFMQAFPRYREARLDMFSNNYPDFYYRFCSKQEVSYYSLPRHRMKDYEQLYSLGKPTCLYVKKVKIPFISQDQWKRAREFLYELPDNAKIKYR